MHWEILLSSTLPPPYLMLSIIGLDIILSADQAKTFSFFLASYIQVGHPVGLQETEVVLERVTKGVVLLIWTLGRDGKSHLSRGQTIDVGKIEGNNCWKKRGHFQFYEKKSRNSRVVGFCESVWFSTRSPAVFMWFSGLSFGSFKGHLAFSLLFFSLGKLTGSKLLMLELYKSWQKVDAICYFSAAAVAESDETYWISTEGYVVEDVEERQLAAQEARFLFFCAATVQLLYSPSLASLGFRFFASSARLFSRVFRLLVCDHFFTAR